MNKRFLRDSLLTTHRSLFIIHYSSFQRTYLHLSVGFTALIALTRLVLQASNASRFILALFKSMMRVLRSSSSFLTQPCISILNELLQIGKSNVGFSSHLPSSQLSCVSFCVGVGVQSTSQANALYHSQIIVLNP